MYTYMYIYIYIYIYIGEIPVSVTEQCLHGFNYLEQINKLSYLDII